MKLKIDAPVLKNTVESASRVISAKGTLPIMECVLIEATNDTIVITGVGSNMRSEITLADGFSLIEPGTVAIHAKTLLAILKKTNSGDVITLEEKDGKLLVKKKGMRCSLQVLSTSKEDYPVEPDMKDAKKVSVPFGMMKKIIQSTIFATGPDDESAAARGCGFTLKTNNNLLTGYSIDGYRCALREAQVTEQAEEFELRIPKCALSELLRIGKNKYDEAVEVSYNSKVVMFKSDNTKLYVRPYNGKPFDIDKLAVPRDNCFTVKTADLYDAINILLPFVNETNRVLRMTLDEEKMHLSVSTPIGEGETEVDIANKNNGEPIKGMTIGFNIHYLMDAVSAVESETFLAIVNSPTSPVKFIDGDGEAYYIVLPVRING